MPALPRVLLYGCALLAACGARVPPLSSTPPPPDDPPAAGLTEREFLVREARVADGAVTVRLEIPPAPAGPKPAVLANLNESTAMLADGIVVVTYKIDWGRLKGAPPPAPKEGEAAAGKWVLAAESPGLIGEHYLRQIAVTATVVVPKVLDYLATVPDVDMSRLAITGASTNGFVALQAVAADRRLGVATVVAACGDWRTFLRDSSMGMEGRPLQLDRPYARWIRSQEIVHRPRRVTHAALLMVNRAQDPLIPIQCADDTARVLERAFSAAGRGDRFRFVRIEEAEGHGLGKRENAENLAWLRTWLPRAR